MIRLERCTNRDEWDEYILKHGGHPLQLWGWGQLKAAHGWSADRVFLYAENDDEHHHPKPIGAAQILIRRLPWPLRSLSYIPRGPVLGDDNRAAALNALAQYAKRNHSSVALTIEPDWEEMPTVKGWRRSHNTILIPHTLILDLKQSESELLLHAAKKTRQYIRKSAAEHIQIRKVKTREEVEACLAIYRQTAERAGFRIHGDQYYIDLFTLMGEYSAIYAAFSEGRPIAFLWLVLSQQTAFELYGGMDDEGQELRANYALKWHVIRTMKEWGLERYDFNGLLNDGISTFKKSFADHESMLAGTYDRPLSSAYGLWARGLPAGKRIVRLFKR